MITNKNSNKNKNWEIGSIVTVGFVKNLKVIEIKKNPDHRPDIYTLESTSGKKYEFVPHNGLYAI